MIATLNESDASHKQSSFALFLVTEIIIQSYDLRIVTFKLYCFSLPSRRKKNQRSFSFSLIYALCVDSTPCDLEYRIIYVMYKPWKKTSLRNRSDHLGGSRVEQTPVEFFASISMLRTKNKDNTYSRNYVPEFANIGATIAC